MISGSGAEIHDGCTKVLDDKNSHSTRNFVGSIASRVASGSSNIVQHAVLLRDHSFMMYEIVGGRNPDNRVAARVDQAR